MILDLGRAKEQCRIEHTDEDVYISRLCVAAEKHFNSYTGRLLYAAGADLSAEPANAVLLDESIEIGAYVLVAWLYENREGGGGLPGPTRMLWDYYRWPVV